MPEPKPIPVDYQSPSPVVRRPITSIGLTIYLGFLTLLVLIFGWFILPRLEAAFADFSIELPLVTRLLLTVVRGLTRGPGIILLLAIPVVVPMLVARFIQSGQTPQQERVRALIVYVAITLLATVLVLWVVLAVLLPWVALIQSVSTPPSGKR